jgi:hypothetical protein
MFRGGAAILAFLTFFAVGAAAQAQSQRPAQAPNPFPDPFQGTPQEQAACRPDSSRFCQEFEPDSLRVLGCLQRNRTKISKSCLQVLQSHGQ